MSEDLASMLYWTFWIGTTVAILKLAAWLETRP